MTPLLENIIAVEVPEGCGDDFEIIRDQDNYEQKQFKFPIENNDYSWVNLPEGNWTFLFCTADASEEQCAGIVEKDWDSDVEGEPPYTRYMRWDVFKNYESGDFELDTAKESLQSLLKSKGLNNCAVLKKIN